MPRVRCVDLAGYLSVYTQEASAATFTDCKPYRREKDMKKFRSLMILGGVFGSLLTTGIVPRAEAQTGCTAALLKGPYAFGIVGNVQGVGPIAASGTTTFDGINRVSFKAFINTTSGAPAIQTEVFGSYTVNPANCTGSATLNVPPPGLFNRFTQVHFEGVIVNGGAEIRYLITTPGIVFAGASVRQFPSAAQ
jgi:hypothetical protein